MSKFGIKNLWDIQSSTPVDTTNLAKTNETNTFTAANTFNADVSIPTSATLNAAKDLTNSNDNQVVNYKGFYWKRIHSQSSLTMEPATIQAYDITTSDLVRQRHVKIMVRITPNNYDYTLTFDLTLNNLTYKNQGEVKFIYWGDNTVSNLNVNNFVIVSVAQYSTNRLRVNIRNLGSSRITTGSIYTYIQMVKPKFQL